MTHRPVICPTQLRRGLRLGWEWGANTAGQQMVQDGVPPRGRLVTIADRPDLTGMTVGIELEGRPDILLDPRLALERGRPLTVLEDAPIPRVLNQHKDGRPAGTVYVGRPSPWGNPFAIGRDGDRDVVMARYIDWLRDQPGLIDRARRELAGKDLVCWCAPARCHGEVLRDLALGRPLPPPGQPKHDPAQPGLPGLSR